MRPVLFHLGPFPIFSFGVMVALGVLLSLFLMGRKSRRTGFPGGDLAFDIVFTVVLVGFLGARILFVWQNWDWYEQNPLKIFAIWEGGLVFYGGLISAFLGTALFCRFKKISFLKVLDFMLPYVALTHAFGRLGCFLNGCCYGRVCSLPWAVQFPELPHAVHPAQLYEASLDFLLFLFLNWKYDNKHFQGEIAALYFTLYALIRFTVEFFRGDNPFVGALTIYQWMSLPLMTLGALAYYFLKRKDHASQITHR